jgi:hypothetical protein
VKENQRQNKCPNEELFLIYTWRQNLYAGNNLQELQQTIKRQIGKWRVFF